MPTRMPLEIPTTEEAAEIRPLAASNKEAVGLVHRARIIAWMLDYPDLTASPVGLQTGYKSAVRGAIWATRFDDEGLSDLQDRPRSGRKPTHSSELRGARI